MSGDTNAVFNVLDDDYYSQEMERIMLFDENFIAVFRRVLTYIKKHYIPNSNEEGTKFSLLNEFFGCEDDFCILLDIFSGEREEKSVKKEENLFCILIMECCDNNTLYLKQLCNKCHLTTKALEGIINKKIKPSKLCVYNFLFYTKRLPVNGGLAEHSSAAASGNLFEKSAPQTLLAAVTNNQATLSKETSQVINAESLDVTSKIEAVEISIDSIYKIT